mmetsp:Transcript_38558/g.127261  ORF Transcript_38558/g.127261 Transcript_38558/m.127261 type:complete len:206 (-) Transcript_38558:233-850(-)
MPKDGVSSPGGWAAMASGEEPKPSVWKSSCAWAASCRPRYGRGSRKKTTSTSAKSSVALSSSNVRTRSAFVRPMCEKPGEPHLASSAPMDDFRGKQRAPAAERPRFVASSVAPSNALRPRPRRERCWCQLRAKSSCAALAKVTKVTPCAFASAVSRTARADSGSHGRAESECGGGGGGGGRSKRCGGTVSASVAVWRSKRCARED